MIQQVLQQNGFEEKEAKVYVAVLEAGEARVSSIASKTGIPRPTVYGILEPMRAKGLVSIAKRNGVEYVSALPPKVLVERFRASAHLAQETLPAMLELAYASPLKPRVRFFEGIRGLKDLVFEMACAGGQAMGATDYEQMPDELFRFIRTKVVPQRRASGTHIRLIVPRNPANLKVQAQDNETFLGRHLAVEFPKKQRSIELLLYGQSTVAFLSFNPKEMFGMAIDSPAIHESLANLFELLWVAYDKK